METICVVLYKETRNQVFAVLFPAVGLIAAATLVAVELLSAGAGTRVDDHPVSVGMSLILKNAFAGHWFELLGVISVPALLTLIGFSLAFSTQITRDEIIVTSKLGEWLPRLAWRVPVRSVVELSIVGYELVAERLAREGAGKGAQITYVGSNTHDFRNAITVSGKDIPLRVRRTASDTHGVMLVLSDESSLFLGFQDPEKALVTIQQAIKMAS